MAYHDYCNFLCSTSATSATSQDSRLPKRVASSTEDIDRATCQNTSATGAAGVRTPSVVETKDASHKYLKVLVPQLVAGTLIGKGGKGLNWFRRKSGVTDLFVSLPDEVFPGTDQRVVVLMGKHKAIIKGLGVIIDLILDKETQIDQLAVRLAVPKSSAALITAKTNVKTSSADLEEGAHVWVASQEGLPTHFQEIVYVVSGKPGEVRTSCKTIATEIQADPSLQDHTNVSYSHSTPFAIPCFDGLRFNATSSLSSAADFVEPTTPLFGVPALVHTETPIISPSTALEGSLTNNCMWNALPSLDLAVSQTPNMASISPTFAVEEPSIDGLLQISEEGTSYGSCGSPSLPPSPEAQNRLISSSPSKQTVEEWSRGSARGPYEGLNMSPHSLSSSSKSKLGLSNLALLLQNREDILNFFTVIETRVPASVAGTIIGAHGRYIREIQGMSGATVNVSRKNDPSSSSDSRTLQILGTVEAVFSAYALCIGRVLKGSERVSSVQ